MVWDDFARAKIRFIGNRLGQKEIFNIFAIGIKKIGKEKSGLVEYGTRVSRIFGFSIELNDHLMKQADSSEEEIHMIAGQRLAQLLLEEIGTA